MIVIELFVPLADNDGAVFTDAHHRAFEQVLVTLFGGFSRLPGMVSGGWSEGGKLYRDDLVIYAVALPSLLDGGKVREAVETMKAHYAQLAVFIRYMGRAEVA